ncbi:MAG: BspA family leucine-rich repeat surface protein, partial [Paenibacillaceae bacterium]|nr:BspA family leucine-rich repeat surface protein [Paenibacillaceae bacterium]
MTGTKWTIAMVLCLGFTVGVGMIEGAFAQAKTKNAQQPMVLVFDTKKTKQPTIFLSLQGEPGASLGKAQLNNKADTVQLNKHGRKNGQEVWIVHGSPEKTSGPYQVTNATANTFQLLADALSVNEKTGKKTSEKVVGDINTDETVTILASGKLPDVTIRWGDGKSERVRRSGVVAHTYAKTGTHEVSIVGTLPWYGSEINTLMDNAYSASSEDLESDHQSLVAVNQFGALGTKSLRGAFRNAVHLIKVPDALPSTVTDMSQMFQGAISFNQPLEKWNVLKVTDMSWMFWGATSFNQPLEKWNVSKVTNMIGMFSMATSFNRPLEKWNVSQVTDTTGMFLGAKSFNQPLGKWNVSNVTRMNYMFNDATSFNQPLEQWNVSKVTDMSGMFQGAASFNKPL